MQGQETGSPIMAIAVVEMRKPRPLVKVESERSECGGKNICYFQFVLLLLCKIFRVPELRIPVHPASLQKVETDMRMKGFKPLSPDLSLSFIGFVGNELYSRIHHSAFFINCSIKSVHVNNQITQFFFTNERWKIIHLFY